MGNGITVIFGRVRTRQSSSGRASELSGPPPGAWELGSADACVAPGEPRDEPQPAALELVSESHHRGRKFERHVRTFRVE